MKVIERLLASNDQLRRQRDLDRDRVQQLSDERARLTAENRSLRDQLDRARDELLQLHQQRVSDWKQRQIDKEKLSRLNHTVRKTRDKQAVGSAAREVKDAADAANLYVTGSRCVHCVHSVLLLMD